MMFLSSSSSSSLLWPTIVVVRRFTHHNHHHRYYRPVLRRRTTNHATTSNNHHHSRPYRPFGIIPLKFISFVITFGSLDIIATYTHYHDDYFHTCFPFPIAFDVGVGASMLPTIGCKQDNNDTTTNNNNDSNMYLRDCSSHRFIWLNANNFYQYCIFSTNKLLRTLSFGGTTTTEHVEEEESVPTLKRPWQRGDVVTLYCPQTKSTVTKRIIGIGGDTINVFGEYAREYSSRRRRLRLDDGDVLTATAVAAGVPYHPLFPVPFCHNIHFTATTTATTTKEAQTDNNIYNNYYTVPPNHVWLEGDNPLQSTDSRHYGPVSEMCLRGRVLLRLWPIIIRSNDNGSEGGYSNSNRMIDNKRPRPPEI